MDQVPVSSIKAVAKKLKQYIDIERREEGFDLSGITCYLGEFRSNKDFGGIGTFHYSCIQDKHMQEYYLDPRVRKRLEAKGVIHKSMLEEMDRRLQKRKSTKKRPKSLGYSQRELQSNHQKFEKTELLETTAELLLNETKSYTRPSTASRNRYRDEGKLSASGSHSSFEELNSINPPHTPSQPSSLVHSTPKSTPKKVASQDEHKPVKPLASKKKVQSAHEPTTSIANTTQYSQIYQPLFPPNPPFIPGSSPYISYLPYYTTPPPANCIPLQPDTGANNTLNQDFSTPQTATPPQTSMVYPPLVHPYQQGYPHSNASGTTPIMVDKGVGYGSSEERHHGKPVLIMNTASVSTATTSDAGTQTPVHVEVQTNKSKLYQSSQKTKKLKKKLQAHAEATIDSPLHGRATPPTNDSDSHHSSQASSKARRSTKKSKQISNNNNLPDNSPSTPSLEDTPPSSNPSLPPTEEDAPANNDPLITNGTQSYSEELSSICTVTSIEDITTPPREKSLEGTRSVSEQEDNDSLEMTRSKGSVSYPSIGHSAEDENHTSARRLTDSEISEYDDDEDFYV